MQKLIASFLRYFKLRDDILGIEIHMTQPPHSLEPCLRPSLCWSRYCRTCNAFYRTRFRDKVRYENMSDRSRVNARQPLVRPSSQLLAPSAEAVIAITAKLLVNEILRGRRHGKRRFCSKRKRAERGRALFACVITRSEILFALLLSYIDDSIRLVWTPLYGGCACVTAGREYFQFSSFSARYHVVKIFEPQYGSSCGVSTATFRATRSFD